MVKQFRTRPGFGAPAVDHAQTKDELQQQQSDHLRGPNARTDQWYSSRDSFVDDGRPKK